MHIEYLQAQNVRNLTNVEIAPGPRLNLFIGPNASGKTALLEAIYILSRGRSFRTPRVAEVIQHRQESLLVAAHLIQSLCQSVRTGVVKGPGKTVIRYNGEIIKKTSDQAKNIPVILIAPDTHRLITGEPKQRRHWLDWGMFHVEPDYLTLWHDYHKSLRQRNVLLKSGRLDNDLLAGWELAMSDTGTRISQLRNNFIKRIQDVIEELSVNKGIDTPQFRFSQGWSDGNELKDCLARERQSDRQLGYTRSGIHRADIEFNVDGRPLSTVFSRGRIKQFVTTLLLAQAVLIQKITGSRPLVLIDDFAAEIDVNTRSRLIRMLLERDIQAFITSTESNPELINQQDTEVFHVEHGELRKVVE